MSDSSLRFLYTNIGRGHPFYLDGIRDAFAARESTDLRLEETDVFAASGLFSRWGWELIRYLYRRGSSPGVTARLYRRLRRNTDYNRGGITQSILGRSLRTRFAHDEAPLLVAHPSLVAMLAGKPNLLYQHGELVTPGEAVVRGASTVFVPTEAAAQPFWSGGYDRGRVIVTGLCIESGLVTKAARALEARIARLKAGTVLVGAFFSSGAEPLEHVRRLTDAALSVAQAGGQAIVVAHAGGRLQRSVETCAREQSLPCVSISATHPEVPEESPLALAPYGSRREEDALTRRLFDRFDYFVAPPHERTNWALGLGLPMFVIGPTIGPFSPLNRELLLSNRVAHPLDSDAEAAGLGALLQRLLASGELAAMAAAGWGTYDTGGFAAIADFIERRYGTIP